MEKSNQLMNTSILYRCTQKFYDKQLAELGIGAGQLIFLISIYENEGISMQNLAKIGCFDKGTVTKGIQKLESGGYVRLVLDVEDRRVKNLYTTDKTKAVIGKIYLLRRDWWDRLTKGMSAEEIEIYEKTQEKAMCNALQYVEEEEEDNLKIFGIQKLTLLDYPGRLASTIFTGGCNFRCPFCQNSDLVFLPENTVEISSKETLQFLEKRKGVVDGVCVSGGEPLLHNGLESYLRKLKDIGYSVKLDTNGSFPDKLKYLVNEGLIDYVAMDIKNCKERYAETIDVPQFDLQPIIESVEFLKTRVVPYEFRTTIVEEFHTLQDIQKIGEWLQGCDAYYLQGFVDSERVIQKGLHAYPKETMEAFKTALKSYIDKVEIRGL